MEDDRSALFNQLREFSQRKLKKVETKVVTGSGELLVEKRGAKGLQVLSGGPGEGGGGAAQEPARKLDLQVGFILPGLLLASQDVAHDKSSLDTYGITHILNLDRDVEHKFEDDYNYKKVAIEDVPEFDLNKVLDECFDFIDDGRHYGNVLVHCSGTVGLSRSTTICVAYLMDKEKQNYVEAFNNVKEARSFVRPNDGFVKQLKEYEVKLRGAQAVKESGIDDPFALRKKQEIEQEKAMVAGASSVKNRMKMFGANLEAGSSGPRSKSVSPAPYKQQQQPSPTTPTPTHNSQSSAASRWSSQHAADKPSATKSMTPEPRKSWQPSGPPPPPPPMPSSSLLGNDKPTSMKPAISSSSSSSPSKSSLPPPPPPPPPPSLNEDTKPVASVKSRYQPMESSKPPSSSQRKGSVGETSEDETGGKRVFGRRPPPPMKLRGGLSIELQDSTNSDKQSDSQLTSRRTNPPQLLQLHLDQGRVRQGPQCMTADLDQNGAGANTFNSTRQRCASPLVLMNNVQTRPSGQSATGSSPGVQSELTENPFNYWQRTLARGDCSKSTSGLDQAAPKRTASLGPKRQIGEGLQRSPFLARGANLGEQSSSTASLQRAAEQRNSFKRAARELQSSLDELDRLIEAPQGRAPARPPPVAPRANKPPPVILREPSQCAGEEQPKEPRFMWQEDLANWKSSSSVNNLLSLFESTKSASTTPLDLPPPSSTPRPRLNSTSVLKRTPWQNQQEQSTTVDNHANPPRDYTIRRTTSTSSSLRDRPVLRNPYRTQYS